MKNISKSPYPPTSILPTLEEQQRLNTMLFKEKIRLLDSIFETLSDEALQFVKEALELEMARREAYRESRKF